MRIQRITPCLWFDSNAEEAARFYCAVFRGAEIIGVSHYGEAGVEIHGRPPGSVLTVEFRLEGQSFTALNGGPLFKFSEAVSFQVMCDTQADIDYYWDRLRAGGDPAAQQCGWLKDRFGVSWQVVPEALPRMLVDPERARTERVISALMKMKKLDIEALERAYAG